MIWFVVKSVAGTVAIIGAVLYAVHLANLYFNGGK